jgi:hypothetical protein
LAHEAANERMQSIDSIASRQPVAHARTAASIGVMLTR